MAAKKPPNHRGRATVRDLKERSEDCDPEATCRSVKRSSPRQRRYLCQTNHSNCASKKEISVSNAHIQCLWRVQVAIGSLK